MNSKVKTLGIIPARGGSKGIPRKNLYPICGKPLIQFSIEAALKAGLDRVIVSTDDLEIAEVAKKLGAEVPLLRSNELAQDHSTISEAVAELLNYLKNSENYVPDVLVKLQPTSPLRTEVHIRDALEAFLNSSYEYSISFSPPLESPFDMVTFDESNKMKFLLEKMVKPGISQRQQHPTSYYINGALYICKTETFIRTQSFFGEKVLPFMMKTIDSIDVDTLDQMYLSELILKSRDARK